MIDEKKLKKELSNLSDGCIVLLETSAEKAQEAGLAVMNILTQADQKAVILSASRPCSNLLNLYQKKGIDVKKVFILCAVCQNQGVKEGGFENVIHLQNATALTNISIALNKSIELIKGKKFIFIDSVTTMLIHNKPDTFVKFIHFILTKMRNNGIGGLLISLESETNKDVRAEIAQLCDKVVKV